LKTNDWEFYSLRSLEAKSWKHWSYGVRRQPPRFGFGAARTDSAHSRVRSLRGLGPSIQLSKIQDYLLDDQCIYMLSEESRQIKKKAAGVRGQFQIGNHGRPAFPQK